MSSTTCRVLSIQSHVVSGYVGNKSATFPLQVLGFEVDAINSVQFSNHKGYPHCRGQILDAEQLNDIFEGLVSNGLHLKYTHLITGFIGSESFLLKVCDVIQELKRANPKLIYVCDPVMGDNGKMYVPKELLPIYRDKILPLADIVTPNQYEAELLSGLEITNEELAVQAMHKLHNTGVRTVVISSSELGSEENLIALGSALQNGSTCSIRMEIPKIPASFTGTGDLFAALLLAWSTNHPHNLQLACEKVLSTMQRVLRRTFDYAKELAGPGNKLEKSQLELRLIQSKKDIEEPELLIKVISL